MKEPSRILVIRRKAIGDVMVSLPVLRALRKRWPEARIDFVVDRFVAPAVRDHPSLDRVLSYDRRLSGEGPLLRRSRATRMWLRRLRDQRYDLVLDLMGTPQTAIWTWVTGAPVRVGRQRRWRTWAYTRVLPRDPGVRFAGEVFLDWVRALGFEPSPWTPEALVRPVEVDEMVSAEMEIHRAAGRPVVLLNPSASWSAKAWPWAHFGALARRLHEVLGAHVLVAWGPGEEAARDAVIRLGHGAARALPPTDLRSLAAWLAAVDLVVTTDSGPKHIAVGEGTPTLTLFGSTDPRGWQPPDPRHRWLSQDVPCRPCNLRDCTVAGHPCLDDLRPERVAEECRRMLEEQTGERA
jgi:lipopolysaccharide heptosyltransferase II